MTKPTKPGICKMAVKLVWVTKVNSRNFITDFGAEVKNIVGGRLQVYEQMVDYGIKAASDELYTKWPNVKNVKFQITEFGNRSVAVIIYGEVNAD